MFRRFFPSPLPPARAATDRYRSELDTLKQRLMQLVSETELVMQISYTKWKIDREKERQIFLIHGVTFPETPLCRQQNEFFTAWERRIEQERQAFEHRAQEIERQQRYELESQRRQELALIETQSVQARRAEQVVIDRAAGEHRNTLERERIAAGREAAELLARALAGDLK